ncbi:small acid-soluble spore protein I (minor) [Caldalkalibacillus uzonensis]|uniref:Small, acid-soluble spore protein I n=1 Tax=Caldalkalibacillus uzonensis TaxID=353224 RepID=A0ABU0CUU5_9BACI|nr:small acid-soluble spore protein SspI [Caldalkalibacillus uzonensis]MDQ0339873.1 small acid-soluble spore protein I (minor) [Caldalkalibacillus uzonensis]
MDLNLREAIKNNMSGSDEAQIRHTIVDAIQSGEEKMLPGLGVLFELMWQNADQDTQQEILQYIKAGLQ